MPGLSPTAAGLRVYPPIATRRIGKASGWFWYSVGVCSFTVTPLVPATDPSRTSNTITVSLLITPAIGCSGPSTTRW